MLIRPDLVAQRGVQCRGRLLYGEDQFIDQVHAEKVSCGPKKKMRGTPPNPFTQATEKESS